MKAYVIHLERAASRRGQVEKIRESLPVLVEIVPAVDGAALSPEAFGARYRRELFHPRYPFELRAGEIGCFLSHRKCWELIVASGDDGAVIVEDDVRIDTGEFSRLLPIVVQQAGRDAYVRFPVKARRELGQVLYETGGFKVISPVTPGLGCQGQYVGREAARALLRATELFDRPVDSFLQLRFEHQVRIWTTQPMVMEEISAEIGNSLIQGQAKSILEKLRRDVVRPIYRKRVDWANRRL